MFLFCCFLLLDVTEERVKAHLGELALDAFADAAVLRAAGQISTC